MEKRLLVFSNIILCFTAMLFLAVFFFSPGIYKADIDNIDGNGFEESVKIHIKDKGLLADTKGNYHDFRLEFPRNVQLNKIKTKVNYMEKASTLCVRGIDERYYMDFPIIGRHDEIRDVVYCSSGNTGAVKFISQEIKILKTTAEDRFLYLDFVSPRDVYDKIVVVDPGCGGDNTGVGNSDITEKDINIKIAKQLYDMLKEVEGLGVFMTRLEDENISEKARIDMANDIEADLFVSIHQNSTASGRVSDMNGTEVMYFNENKNEDSKEFAESLQKNLTNKLGSRDMGLVPANNIEVLKRANCPAALVKIGFMSNPKELQKLSSDKYQRDCANALYIGIMESLYEDTDSNRQ